MLFTSTKYRKYIVIHRNFSKNNRSYVVGIIFGICGFFCFPIPLIILQLLRRLATFSGRPRRFDTSTGVYPSMIMMQLQPCMSRFVCIWCCCVQFLCTCMQMCMFSTDISARKHFGESYCDHSKSDFTGRSESNLILLFFWLCAWVLAKSMPPKVATVLYHPSH